MEHKLIKALTVLILPDVGRIVCQLYQTRQQNDALTFEAVDMSRLQGDSYEGECQASLAQVRLRLRIQDAVTQRVKPFRHDNGMRKDVKHILKDIQKQNNTAVDDVSSAVIPSKAIRMVAQNALEKATLPQQSSLPHSTGEWGMRSPTGMNRYG